MKSPDFKKILAASSPEQAKKDRAGLATTFKTSVDTLEVMRTWGVYTPESLAVAGQTLAKELLDISLEVAEQVEEEMIVIPEEMTEDA